MDWGWIIIFGLAIVGAALIAGGAVAYLGTTTMSARRFWVRWESLWV